MNEHTTPQPGQQTPPASGPHPDAEQQVPPTAPASDRFFAWIRNLGITRSQDRWFGGVAAGIARRWQVDPLVARALTLVILLFTGVGWVVYAAAWALLPEERDGRIHAEELFRGHFAGAYIGIGLFLVIGGSWNNEWFGFPLFSGAEQLRWLATGTNALISTALVVAIVVFIMRAVQQNRTSPPSGSGPASSTAAYNHSTAGPTSFTAMPATGVNDPPFTPSYDSGDINGQTQQPVPPHADFISPVPVAPPTPSPSWRALPARMFALIFGLALLSVAAVLVAHNNGLISGNASLLAGGAALAVLGLGMTISGIAGRSAGSLGGLVILALLAVGPVAGWNTLTNGTNNPAVATFSDTTWAPTTAESVERGYLATVGNATLDLTELSTTPGETITIPVRFAAGSVSIVVPANTPISAQTQIFAGNVDWNAPGTDRQTGGLVSRNHFETPAVTDGATPRIHLDLRGAAGSITIEETS